MDSYSAHFYQSANRPAVRYISGSTVYEECLQDGRFIGLYWSSACQVHRENVVENIPPQPRDVIWKRLESFSLEIDGQLLDGFWDYADSYIRENARGYSESVVELHHTVRPVTVRIVTGLDGTAILSRCLEVTNNGSRPAALGAVEPFRGMLWGNLMTCQLGEVLKIRMPFDRSIQTEYSVGYLESNLPDTAKLGLEGNFVWQPIENETFVIRRTERKPYGNPFYIVRNNLTGEVFFASLAWSGGFEAKLRHDREHHTLSFGLGPAGPAPLRVLKPGETIVTPSVHIGPMHGDLDTSISEWHRHLRQSVLTPRPADKQMYTTAGRVIEHPDRWILREVDIAAEMGVEAFMVDAGWYGDEFATWVDKRGDWQEGPFLPDGGIAAIREYVHSKKMLFGLWMEPEAISVKSRLYENHPDWRVTYDGDKTASIGDVGVLDLAKPEVASHLRDQVLQVIEGKKLDFFKLDYNMNIVEGGRYLTDGFAENQAWRHFECLYGIFEEVLARHPEVVLENCASGGGRNDLGMLGRFHYAAQSDWSVFPFSIRAINGMTLFLPPETLCYYHNHMTAASQMADIDTHLRVALFCSPIFVGYGGQDADRDTLYFRKVRAYTELLKSFCRPIMNHPTVYHHTPDIGLYGPAQWCVLEYCDDSHSRGYAGLFRLDRDPTADEMRFYPKGTRPDTRYEVELHNTGYRYVCTGQELMERGVRIHLSSVNTSELILYRELGEEK